MLLVAISTSIYAKEGEMGYFGGISVGTRLPTAIERSQDKKTSNTKVSIPYKENVYLTGKAETVTGTIEFKPGSIDKTKGKGKYSEAYTIKAANGDGTVKVTRSITINTEYVYNAEINQTTKISTLSKWTETISIDGSTYTLDKNKSSFSMSTIEEYMPGVTYYRGDLQYDAVYKSAAEGESFVTVSVTSPIYAYEHAYAKGEVQKRTVLVDKGKQQFYITESPSTTVYKDMQYDKNELNATSMDGNYKDLIRGEGYLNYNIIQGSSELSKKEKAGTLSLSNSPIIEQLVVPKVANIQGNPAQNAIKRLYSLGAVPVKAENYKPNALISKKDYILMLVKSLQLKVEPQKTISKRQNPFKDVSSLDNHYPELLAAYDTGLIGKGVFNGSAILTKEQALTLNVRALGLERLGSVAAVNTPFIDDAEISGWAKKSVYVSYKLGLMNSSNEKVNPKKKVSHSEAAILINSLIDYMRYDLQKDYNEYMTM